MAARLTKLLLLAALALAVTASSGSAASPVRTPLLGVVPHASGAANPLLHALPSALGFAGPTTLTFDANYQILINRYFRDVAADSGKTTNVYSVATQYTGNNGAVQYQSTVGGAYVDHGPLPANGCDDNHNGIHDAYCLTDQQLQAEIQSVMAATGWQGGYTHMFFLMTPNGVGSCESASNTACSTNVFCAYHSAFGTLEDPVIYANEPYLGPSEGCANPNDQGFPNGDVDAETTINTISHEHNEAITDPIGNGWIAADGEENGDLCAYIFGDPLGGTAGTTAWNQVINGHKYALQEEYSNEKTGCVQRRGDGEIASPANVDEQLPFNGGPVMPTNTTYAIYWLPNAGNTSLPAVTGTAHVKQSLTTSAGSWTGGPSGFHDQWQRCSSSGTSCVNIPGATASRYTLTAADGGHTVRSTVVATNVNGSSSPAASAPTALVIDVPAVTKPPHISGRARVGKKLSGSHGAWTYAPTAYRLQWLRCNGHGGHCSSIHHATRATYKLTKRDAKHRLRLRVTATNAVGSKVAVSTASARVPAPKKKH